MKYRHYVIALVLALPAVTQANQTKGSVDNDSDIACLFCCDNSCNGSSALAQGENKEEARKELGTVVALCFPGGGCEGDQETPV